MGLTKAGVGVRSDLDLLPTSWVLGMAAASALTSIWICVASLPAVSTFSITQQLDHHSGTHAPRLEDTSVYFHATCTAYCMWRDTVKKKTTCQCDRSIIKGKVLIVSKREKISRGVWRSPEQRERNKVVMVRTVCNRGKEMQENMGWTNHTG